MIAMFCMPSKANVPFSRMKYELVFRSIELLRVVVKS